MSALKVHRLLVQIIKSCPNRSDFVINNLAEEAILRTETVDYNSRRFFAVVQGKLQLRR
jgi:hypothetical protein